MGIKGLRKLLEHNAPKSMKERNLDNYFRRIIAVDASISIYQFLTAMNPLQNDNGEETSHLVGMFCRTAKFLEAGIEPVYVFDGTPPDMKKQEIAKRNARREDAKKELLDLTGAVEDGDEDKGKDAEELRKRTVKVTSTHYNGCKRLLQLMGVPVIQAPSEAEAQCSHLCKDGKTIKNIVRGRSKPLQRIDGIFMLKRKEASEKDTEAASNKKTKA
ncbi:unnamed protein product [Miscanthus lutarioriparius]|uniref:XPG N-terminal domain-containing protein n=1 Tax=Miscanthus lutarioriparius TaxID=422564 RepID=A0A811PFK3_9POAL|nr:unnamed protein product [Miscanthus lutarioriparius]